MVEVILNIPSQNYSGVIGGIGPSKITKEEMDGT
jgi:hypothetical protein